MRTEQSTYIKWDVLTSDGFIKEIKSEDQIASVTLLNQGEKVVTIFGELTIQPNGSIAMGGNVNTYLNMSRMPVTFSGSGTSKLVVLAERITDIKLVTE